MEGLSDTLDVIILGGYFGEGKTRIGSGYNIGQDWTEFITHFLLGIALKVNTNNPKESAFLPFCKVGTGYTVNELKTLRQKMRLNWKKNTGGQPPGFIH